ncbi:hypothetical protein [Oceanobacillus chungangensis]|uniref:Uncharacterized protein n=1 Tax=Oceanobacillus chungangensis TaxID=1229152 RepID=A0A3D8Q295_9BACI|nr:hypothetical protein [Oceanobacillus chungangensis]RDW21728.1 hypothetical protein CWR45_02315 [Oceanobacillus chungangensis]
MEDFFSPLINILKVAYDAIAKFVFSTVLWIIDLIKNFLLDTGITDDVVTATVIAVIIMLSIFLFLVGWFLGPIRVYGGGYDSDDD